MIKDIPGLIEKVTIEIKNFTDVAVLGLSGGADSTLVACLCVKALGAKNVYGLHMPYNTLDLDTFNSRSKVLAKYLGVNDNLIQIGTAVDELSDEFSNLSTLNQGNMRSRMRMIALYTYNCQLAESTGKRCRVVGTGNLAEDAIGFQTKYGDSGCDFFPIGSLYKSEVYQLLEYFRDQNIITNDMIDRVPSAGLWSGHTDFDEIGYTYDEMEPSLRRVLSNKIDENKELDIIVNKMYLGGLHKIEPAPVIKLREFCD